MSIYLFETDPVRVGAADYGLATGVGPSGPFPLFPNSIVLCVKKSNSRILRSPVTISSSRLFPKRIIKAEGFFIL